MPILKIQLPSGVTFDQIKVDLFSDEEIVVTPQIPVPDNAVVTSPPVDTTQDAPVQTTPETPVS